MVFELLRRRVVDFDVCEFSSGFQLWVKLLEYGLVEVGKAFVWSNIVNCTVRASMVVISGERFGNALCVLDGQGCFLAGLPVT